MKTESLIDDLSKKVEPVQPVFAAGVLSVVSVIVVAAVVTLGLFLFPLHHDFSSESYSTYWLDLLLPVGIAILCVLLVDRMSIPGRSPIFFSTSWLWSLWAVLIGVEIVRGFSAPAELIAGADLGGLKCSEAVALISIFPAVFLWLMARNRAVTKPHTVGMLIAFASLATGMVEIALHCTSANAAHIVLYHFALPLLAGGIVATFVLAKSLRW